MKSLVNWNSQVTDMSNKAHGAPVVVQRAIARHSTKSSAEDE